MGGIYAGAETVLVWLGESMHLSPGLPQFLEEVGPGLDPIASVTYAQEHNILHKIDRAPGSAAWLLGVLGIARNTGKMAALSRLRRLNEPLRALFKVLSRVYFQRAWVVQEVALAKQVVFWIGGMEIPSKNLVRGARLAEFMEGDELNLRGMAISAPMGSHRGYTALRHIVPKDHEKGVRLSFQDLLFLCRDREATIPEDKVNTLLGSADQELRDALCRHRGSSFQRFYIGCAMEFARRETMGWPYVLSLNGMPFRDGSAGLSSWVPDLRTSLAKASRILRVYTLPRRRARPAHYFHPDPQRGTLYVSACDVDTVDQVGES